MDTALPHRSTTQKQVVSSFGAETRAVALGRASPWYRQGSPAATAAAARSGVGELRGLRWGLHCRLLRDRLHVGTLSRDLDVNPGDFALMGHGEDGVQHRRRRL